jgi:cysteine-rich CPXCG protein
MSVPGRLMAHHIPVESVFVVTCPYCGEEVEIYLEPEIRGSLIQDCEVCCNPWNVYVSPADEDGERYVQVSRADGSD